MFGAVLGVRGSFRAYFSLNPSVAEPLLVLGFSCAILLKKTLHQKIAWVKGNIKHGFNFSPPEYHVEQLHTHWLSERHHDDYDLCHSVFRNVK